MSECPEADDFYDDAEDPNDLPGPIFTATFDSEDACCGHGIEAGERIRADGDGGWVHAACQEMTGAAACGRCFLVHKGECL